METFTARAITTGDDDGDEGREARMEGWDGCREGGEGRGMEAQTVADGREYR